MRSETCDGNVTCIESFKIIIENNILWISSATNIYADRNQIFPDNFPYVWMGLEMSYYKQFLLLKRAEFVVKFDIETRALSVILKNDYFSIAQGLCGNNNGQVDDEYTSRYGQVFDTAHDFSLDWRVGVDSCELPPYSNQLCELGETLCNIMKTNKFARCMDVLDFEDYYNRCVHDVCTCNANEKIDCHCSVLTQLSRDCARAHLPVEDWRTSTMCARECPANSFFSESSPGCPETCFVTAEVDCSTPPSDGCMCPQHLYWSDEDQACVPNALCPCIHGGVFYISGDHVDHDCNTCVCTEGMWDCSDNPCPGVGVAYGTLHFITFDKLMYTFVGTCSYTLMQTADQSLRVTAFTDQCTESYSCLRSIELDMNSFSDSPIHMELVEDTIRFLGNPVDRNELPFTQGNITVRALSSLYLVVEIVNPSFTLLWSKEGAVYVEVPIDYQCNNFCIFSTRCFQ